MPAGKISEAPRPAFCASFVDISQPGKPMPMLGRAVCRVRARQHATGALSEVVLTPTLYSCSASSMGLLRVIASRYFCHAPSPRRADSRHAQLSQVLSLAIFQAAVGQAVCLTSFLHAILPLLLWLVTGSSGCFAASRLERWRFSKILAPAGPCFGEAMSRRRGVLPPRRAVTSS